MSWDVFICHASSDKDTFVRQLARALSSRGIAVWYDELTLSIGDSLRKSVDRGLAESRFGIVILSEAFFAKQWPQKELDALASKEVDGRKVILPVWHGLTAEDVHKHSPMLADRIAANSQDGVESVVEELYEVVRPRPGYETSEHRLDGIMADEVMAIVDAGLIVISPDKTISLMNQSAESILQLDAAEVEGRSVQELGSGFADMVLGALRDGEPRLRQEIHDPGIDAVLEINTTPLRQGGVLVDFSKLPEEKAETEDLAYSPFWEYFANRVGHEVKNPMVAINTFAQLLPRKYDSEDFREAFCEVVQQEIARINKVVEVLFEFARHPRLELKRTSVNTTVRNVLRTYEAEFDARGIALESRWDQRLPEADLDPDVVSQAFDNVVQNAIDSMPSGGALIVSTRRRDDTCEVLIADTGPGIPEQDEPLIFLPFFSTKEMGMGLGLTIAQRIMRQHGGELALRREASSGAAFVFFVPVTGSSLPEATAER